MSSPADGPPPETVAMETSPNEPRTFWGRGGQRWVLATCLLVWLVVALPAALGEKTFFVRDVFSNNFPQKVFGAEQLRHGRIPALNPNWALGQPYRGNPATLAFYPGNVLYLVLPFWNAFNLHFVLHWLLALFGMRALARALDQSEAAALLAGITYAGCGWLLSTLTFYNIVVVAGWWPWVMAFAVRGGRRGVILGGAACGMALLGGEPITAVLGLVPMLLAVIPRHGWRRGLTTVFAVGLLGMVVALPQVIATARIFSFSFRGGHGNFTSLASQYFLQPFRVLELLLPLPFGWHGFRGPLGIWYEPIVRRLPFFLSIYGGVVALVLAFGSRRTTWLLLGGSSVVLAMLGDTFANLLTTLSFGLFRYPEKLIFWFALSLPLLAGWGLDRLLRERVRWWRGLVLTGSALALGVAGVLALLRGGLVQQIEERTLGHGFAFSPADVANTQLWKLTLELFLMGVLLFLSVWAVRQQRPAVVVGCQLVALLQLFPVVQTDFTAYYRALTPWEEKVGPGAAVASTRLMLPPWHGQATFPESPAGPRRLLQRVGAQDLFPAPGSLHGLQYPFALNLEGLNSPFCTLLEINLARLDWSARYNWFRVMGLDALTVLYEPPSDPRFELLDTAVRYGETSRLYRIPNPAPKAWWPETATPALNPREALREVSFAEDPVRAVVTSKTVEHHGGGTVTVLQEAPDRIELEITSPAGGIAVLQRAYHPLLVARLADGSRAPTLPVNLVLTGIVVPPGTHRVILAVSQWPEIAASLLALGVLAGALWTGWRQRP